MADQKKRESVKKVKSNPGINAMTDEVAEAYYGDLGDDTSLESMDDVYEALQNEFDQVRKCIGMYISYTNTAAAMHLFKEIAHNAFDEHSNGKVSFSDIFITFDESTQTFTVRDGGRGIPFAKLKDVCMKKHVSTKYERSEIMKRYAGRNGVGMKVTVALTDFFRITSNRNTVSQTIVFNDGEPTVMPVTALKHPDHGLEVSFKPSEKYLGDLFVNSEMVEDYLRRMSYLIPEGLFINYEGHPLEGKSRKIKYRNQGLVPAVNFLSASLEFPVTPITIETPDFDLDIAFSYDKSLDVPLIESYCNYVHTTEGGAHETALIRALCEFFVREAKNLEPNSKYEVSYDDCKKGLVAVVAGWHYNPGFEGQHKSKVNNDDFIKVGKECLKSALTEYFQRNNGLLRRIVGLLRKNVQVRMEANKIKGTKVAKLKNALDFMGIAGFEDISDPNYSKASEILIAEGVSAVGAIKNIRNRKFQAVYGVMGVVNNVSGCSLQQVMAMPIYANLVKVLGCGIGPSFNIANLRFKKIIIVCDSDVDGSNITSLLLEFFWKFLPELITQGYVYKAISPLYKIDTYPIRKYYKGNYWLYSKKELYNVFNDIVAANIEIAFKDGKNMIELNKAQKKRFLELNAEYLMEYDMILARTSGHDIVTEYAVYYRYLYKKNVDKFKAAIEAKFPEVEYDIFNQSLTGSYNGESISLLVDDLFDTISKRIYDLLFENDFFEFYYMNKNDQNQVYELTTLASFFREMRSIYNVNVLQRFKGLGEAGDELLFVTTINPKLRKLIRFTVRDAEELDAMLKLFHGKKTEDREARRNLIATTDISYADIDN